MAKAVEISGLLLLAALIAGTTYAAVAAEKDNPRGDHKSCQKEIQKMKMGNCMQWMKTVVGGGGGGGGKTSSPYEENDVEPLEECCKDMKDVMWYCRCEAMRHMMKQMQKQLGGKQQIIKDKVLTLPHVCSMTSPTHCRFRTALFV
ncbi:hypothetical protein ACP275_13G093400 [Erythranthe tilingii]